jgi:DNA-binding NarL/FixJ family response regulator
MLTNKPKHIFIVEDNQIYSMMLDYILSKDSVYQFVSFKSGEECLENLYLNPDIIILDYGLPGMNGYETLLEIKKRNPKIHVVILSHYNDPELKRKMIDAGAVDFILKQGHGEKQIIERIEQILLKDEMEKEEPLVKKKPYSKMLYLILFITLLITGFFVTRTLKNKPIGKTGNIELINEK